LNTKFRLDEGKTTLQLHTKRGEPWIAGGANVRPTNISVAKNDEGRLVLTIADDKPGVSKPYTWTLPESVKNLVIPGKNLTALGLKAGTENLRLATNAPAVRITGEGHHFEAHGKNQSVSFGEGTHTTDLRGTLAETGSPAVKVASGAQLYVTGFGTNTEFSGPDTNQVFMGTYPSTPKNWSQSLQLFPPTFLNDPLATILPAKSWSESA
jgi:hypothetical protein